ncbi:uncharacterized protein PHACADRAFT_257459 [Phanerochaete carnosa HHB-10118-sp]|uniref:Uncharacterized protein n=1 Tax=Phanerochaete carnosa (strain HHB-10118-sp) TaxID=650164 RepID=K5W482_PHACS|nr:uncharacterized protein PHACADRAFT_257459 [Phanerochaete carnosa HHB-10118-sp]EKM53950.1 hypothetical protein PHACADRAFT_257459 [Phanerochaete carnosa HHB-10118-sp]
MSTLESLLPHARRYLEGMILDEGLPRPLFRGRLPECWERKATSTTASVFSLVNADGLAIDVGLNVFKFQDGESSALYITEGGIDSSYPFYYYEVRITVVMNHLQSNSK